MKLLPSEEIISKSESGILILTTYRLRYAEKGEHSSDFSSVMLESISSVEVKYLSQPIYLVLGVIFTLGGFSLMQQGEEFGIVSIAIGLGFGIGFFLSRRHSLVITANGGEKISFQTRGMKKEKIQDIVYQMEEAIDKRRHAIKSS